MAHEYDVHSLEAQQSRVLETGSIWLDSVFVARSPRLRFRKSGIRLSIPDLIWIVLLTVVFTGLFYVLLLPLAWLFPSFVQPLLIAPIGGVVLGWVSGRKVARASPYRTSTGEGIGSYLYVQADTKSYVLKRIFGRTVAMSRCVSMAGPRRQVVDCVEWLGTARAAVMPRYDPDEAYEDNAHPVVEVEFEEQTVPTDWINQKRLRREGF